MISADEKISVIMGIYNCEKTLPQAIESIIRQTYTNWELIMCDDCSTDNTYEVADYYSKQYPEKIILIKNEKNSKLAYSLNHCLKYATGKFVARMDGDDISHEQRFEKELEFLFNNPDVDLVGCAMQRFDENGMADIEYAVDHPDYYTLRRNIPFNHATILTYKYVYDILNGYTVEKRTQRAQDYDLWFRFYYNGFKGENLREPLYLVREDLNAIKRRTIKVRVSVFRTTVFGFRLLGYPKIWLFKAGLSLIIKCLIPSKIMLVYRKYQKKINSK